MKPGGVSGSILDTTLCGGRRCRRDVREFRRRDGSPLQAERIPPMYPQHLRLFCFWSTAHIFTASDVDDQGTPLQYRVRVMKQGGKGDCDRAVSCPGLRCSCVLYASFICLVKLTSATTRERTPSRYVQLQRTLPYHGVDLTRLSDIKYAAPCDRTHPLLCMCLTVFIRSDQRSTTAAALGL